MSSAIRERQLVVRVPARDRHDRVICAECGRLVDQEASRQRIANPDLADPRAGDDLEELYVGGWRCEEHRYDVVMPITFYGQEPSLPPSFEAVELAYSDQEVRWVVVRQTDRPIPWP